MRKLLSYFIKYPIAGNILMFMLILMGWVGMKSLRTTFFPERESTLIQIRAVYPGASPAEIEEGIVLKIEDKLEGVNGIERVTSQSLENTGIINIEVNSNYKTDAVLQHAMHNTSLCIPFQGLCSPYSWLLDQFFT